MVLAVVSGWFSDVKKEVAAWGKTEGSNWIFVLKTPLAALLAMLISMRLELDQPRTAMVTVFVVMQPQTGLVLAKSLYRIVGTLAGTVASLVLVAMFAQERELFLLGLALWVGFCTAGAAFYRNFKSYGFVLAGYTAALIGLPAAMQPTAFFSLATTRLIEVALGILCAGVFSDTIFPRRLSDAIITNVQSRYTDFIALVTASLNGAVGGQQLERMQLRLVKDVIGLESIRGAAILEDPEVRARDFKLRKLNSEFMAAAATFNCFHQLLKRLIRSGNPAGLALNALYESFGGVLLDRGEVPGNAAAAHRAARRIAAFRVVLSRRVDEVRNSVSGISADPQASMDFETAVELLFRFVRELHAYTRTYAALPEKVRGPRPPDDIRFATRTDPLVALVSGGRALIAILMVGTFWILSAWPYGISALMFVTIVSALCAAAPDPPQTAKQMVLGFAFGFVPAMVFKFLIVPSLDGFMLLAATMAPFLLAGSYVATRPKVAGFGAGFMIYFTNMTNPSNFMQFDPVDFINDGSGIIVGVAVAGIMFAILFPATGAWFQRRLARQLRHQVVMVCSHPLPGLAHRFESGTHDLLHTLAATQQNRDAQERYLMAWMFPVLEIGRAVIQVRKEGGSIQMSQRLADRIRQTVRLTALLFNRPTLHHRKILLASVVNAIETVAAESQKGCPHTREALRRMLASLHLIRTVLLEEEMLLDSTAVATSAPLSGETPHAA